MTLQRSEAIAPWPAFRNNGTAKGPCGEREEGNGSKVAVFGLERVHLDSSDSDSNDAAARIEQLEPNLCDASLLNVALTVFLLANATENEETVDRDGYCWELFTLSQARSVAYPIFFHLLFALQFCPLCVCFLSSPPLPTPSLGP